jgi:hypothetical protein
MTTAEQDIKQWIPVHEAAKITGVSWGTIQESKRLRHENGLVWLPDVLRFNNVICLASVRKRLSRQKGG